MSLLTVYRVLTAQYALSPAPNRKYATPTKVLPDIMLLTLQFNCGFSATESFTGSTAVLFKICYYIDKNKWPLIKPDLIGSITKVGTNWKHYHSEQTSCENFTRIIESKEEYILCDHSLNVIKHFLLTRFEVTPHRFDTGTLNVAVSYYLGKFQHFICK